MNTKEVVVDTQYLQAPNWLTSSAEIDRYAEYLAGFIKYFIDDMMSYAKLIVEYIYL